MGISDTLFEANTDLKKGYIWYFVTHDETFQYDESTKKEVREIITKIENLNRNLDTPPDYVPEKIEEWFPLQISLHALQKVIAGERAVTTVIQIRDE